MVFYGIFPPLMIYYDIMVCKPQDNWNWDFFSGRPNCQAFFFFKGLEDILSTQAWRAGFWYAGTNSQELLCKRGNGYAHVRLCLKIISVRNYQVQLQQLCACYLPCIIYLFAAKPDLTGLTSGRRAGATHPPQLRYGLSWDCPPPKKVMIPTDWDWNHQSDWLRLAKQVLEWHVSPTARTMRLLLATPSRASGRDPTRRQRRMPRGGRERHGAPHIGHLDCIWLYHMGVSENGVCP
jgi:hypothetical protein